GPGVRIREALADTHVRVATHRGRSRSRRRATSATTGIRWKPSRAFARSATIDTREASFYPLARAPLAGDTPRPGPGPSGTFSAAVSGTLHQPPRPDP